LDHCQCNLSMVILLQYQPQENVKTYFSSQEVETLQIHANIRYFAVGTNFISIVKSVTILTF
jgi:hypothetical protein